MLTTGAGMLTMLLECCWNVDSIAGMLTYEAGMLTMLLDC